MNAVSLTKMDSDFSVPDSRLRQESTCTVVSVVAYLIGVPSKWFGAPFTGWDAGVCVRLDADADARSLRALCALRTVCACRFRTMEEDLVNGLRNLDASEYTRELVAQLRRDGIDPVRANAHLNDTLARINTLIEAQADACRGLFPQWVSFRYLRQLFVIPGGGQPQVSRQVLSRFAQARGRYPYSQFLNWKFPEPAPETNENILRSDKVFLEQLYAQNGAVFTGWSMVHDAGKTVKKTLSDFLDAGDGTVALIDCENADVTKAAAVLDAIPAGELARIFAFDDIHASSAWELLGRHAAAPVTRETSVRIKPDKSTVDFDMQAAAQREYYLNGVRRFLIFSSDSDFCTLLRALPDAEFFFVIELSKAGRALTALLEEQDIPYCYSDLFCQSGSADALRREALQTECCRLLNERLGGLTENALLENALARTRTVMSEPERREFLSRWMGVLQLAPQSDGTMGVRPAAAL